DTQVLQQALKDSNGSLELAVAFLTAKNAKIPQQEETTYYQTALPGNDRYISVGSQADTNVIDLTGDDKDDLQRAIALSLEESNRAFRETGITDEEQAISRVLEASIAENKASLKRTHPEVWSDSPNPYDRKRQDNCPVGLKNVGNTCWFSAVIQSLFNLLEFRRLVLNYSPPGSAQDLPRNQKVKSHRDLSYEFTHKLLDWLEDAFQIKAEEEQDGEKPKNPMVELFYGRFLAVGVLEGKKFENAEMFGQYPLQVNGFKDLHECLEAAMVEGEIESLHSENSGKSGQEVKYLLDPTHPLPTSTMDCLDAFNHACQEGIEEVLYTTEQQGPSTEMQSTSPAQRSVIHKPFTQSRIPPDLPMHPAPRHITEEELSVLEGCLHRWRTEVENDTRDLQESIARIQRTIELMYSDKSMVQVPYRLHAVLVHEGQANAGHYWAYIYDSYQRRWMKYNDISVTRSTWEELERDSFGGYRNASAYCLMYINDKEPFLIQEEFNKETGQMVVGIDTLPPDLRDYVREDNKRFEKELEEWDAQIALKAQEEKALISQTARVPVPFTARGEDPEYLEQPSRTDVSKQLKEDSIRAITKAFTEQEDKNPETVMNVKSDSTQVPTAPNQKVVEVPIPDVGTYVIQSEQGGYDDEVMLTPNMQGVIMAIAKATNVYDKCGPEAGFFQAIKSEYARLLKLAQEDTPPECDYRLHHAIVYFILNQAPKKIIERTLLEQFADHNLSFDERCRNIMKVAQAKIGMIKPGEVNMEDYEWWHQEYKNFRETTVYLIFQEALLYLIFAYHKNKELSSRGLYRGHDEELISHYRRECLLKLNECAAAQFESGDDNEVNKGLEIMNELIVPCLPLLLVDETEEKDIVAVEDMRNRWCSYLGQEMEPNLQEKLTDFLPKLLDCSTEIKGFNDPPKLPSYSTHELCERFARIMLSLSRTPADGR
uniref:Ubiquitin carboxyl-terminal hydrolase n=1 Tax=Anolis carolinensis TaxID=28377 RepID=A0A803TPB0_ANOCA